MYNSENLKSIFDSCIPTCIICCRNHRQQNVNTEMSKFLVFLLLVGVLVIHNAEGWLSCSRSSCIKRCKRKGCSAGNCRFWSICNCRGCKVGRSTEDNLQELDEDNSYR